MSMEKKGLFKETQDAKYLPNFILIIILAIIFLIVGQIMGGFIYPFLIWFSNNPASRQMVGLIANFIFVALIIFLWVKFFEKRKFSSMGFRRNHFMRKYFVGFGIGIIMFSSVILLLSVTGNISIAKHTTVPIGLMALSSILTVLPGWMIQSATEEIISRGWMMSALGARYNLKLAIVISSSFFSLLHIFNPSVSLIAIINILLVGIFLGIYVIKANDLWGVCGIHCSWNWVQGNIFGLNVSGLDSQTGSLTQLKVEGAKWFTGGNFGPEGGIAASIILIVSIFILVNSYRLGWLNRI